MELNELAPKHYVDQQKTDFNEIPVYVTSHIFSYLDTISIRNAACVSER